MRSFPCAVPRFSSCARVAVLRGNSPRVCPALQCSIGLAVFNHLISASNVLTLSPKLFTVLVSEAKVATASETERPSRYIDVSAKIEDTWGCWVKCSRLYSLRRSAVRKLPQIMVAGLVTEETSRTVLISLNRDLVYTNTRFQASVSLSPPPHMVS